MGGQNQRDYCSNWATPPSITIHHYQLIITSHVCHNNNRNDEQQHHQQSLLIENTTTNRVAAAGININIIIPTAAAAASSHYYYFYYCIHPSPLPTATVDKLHLSIPRGGAIASTAALTSKLSSWTLPRGSFTKPSTAVAVL
jgi:hypothetical protein